MTTEEIDRVLAGCRELDPAVGRGFLERLGGDYLAKFDPQTIARHVSALASLSEEKPVAVLCDQASPDGPIDCTVVAFDHPFEFSCITGLLAATGFTIESSEAFTLPRARSSARRRELRRRAGQDKAPAPRRGPARDAVILDHFRGKLLGPSPNFGRWSEVFEPAVIEILRLLDRRDEPSTERAKRLVTERVTQWLKAHRAASGRQHWVSAPVDEVSIEPLPRATRLRLRARDAPAFLYTLSTALSLHGLQIDGIRVQTIEGQAVDEIDVVDSRGEPLTDPARLQQLRLSVLLTQQFAYILDRAPDPFTALRRFEQFSEIVVQTPQRDAWIELFGDPLSMTDLAKVLGASDFLWEDFIRSHADELLPAIRRHVSGHGDVGPPSRGLPRRLGDALAGASHFEDQRIRLNDFKDRELFLIDLDHILSDQDPDVTLQALSERLVFLAENLVATAARLVYAELLRLYGRPKDEQGGGDVAYAVFGLGKLGGVALGYASDIELLFLFDAAGRTAGGARGSLSNDEFFAILTRETCASIHAQREGIFQIDLRLRPWGKGGPLASTRQRFDEYYGPAGPAHSFERLALVRLRWIAGDPLLGFAVEAARDRLLYDGPSLDTDVVREITEQMRAQHLRGRRELNAKYSPGGLVDLETAIQLLQVTLARTVPQLRTPRIQEAVQGLWRAGVLSAAEFETLTEAYQFFRRLINAQRMLRGSAQDLFLPPEGSDELLHLARRMNSIPKSAGAEGSALMANFQNHSEAIRQFLRRRFKTVRPR